MSVRATIVSDLTITEVINDRFLDPVSNPTITHNWLDTQQSLSNDDITKVASTAISMVSGAKTINLTAIPGTNGGLQNGTGLQVKAIKLQGRSSNLHAIAIVPGASNGLDLFGANFAIGLKAGQHLLYYFGDDGARIDSTHKTIDMSGDEVETLELSLVMG